MSDFSTYNVTLIEPWFSLINIKKQTVYSRLNKDDFSKIKKNDVIIFQNDDFGFERKCKVKITSVHNYDTFKEYLEKEKLDKCLPGIENINEGCFLYNKYYKKELENKHKVIAFRLKKLKD